MGVKDLTARLEEICEKDDVIHDGLAPSGRVLIDEFMLRIYTYASMYVEMPLVEFFEMMTREYVEFLLESSKCFCVVVVADDIKRVPRQKIAEQKKRRVAIKERDIYPPHMQLLPCVECVDGEWTVTEGGIYDTQRKLRIATVCPAKLVLTGHMRALFTKQVYLYLTHIVPWPSHSLVFFDMGMEEGVKMHKSGQLRNVHPSMCNQIGEGEIKAVWWYLKLRAVLPRDLEYKQHFAKGGNFLIKTKDMDVMPVIALQGCWEVSKQTYGLILINKRGQWIEVGKLFDSLSRSGWTPASFVGACILSGTDYSSKNHSSFFIGIAEMWKTLHRLAKDVPKQAPLKPEHHTTLHYPSVRKLFDTIVISLYAGAIDLPNACASKWSQIVDRKYKDKRIRPKPPGSVEYKNGLSEFVWLWVYWATCGSRISDLILCRDEINPFSVEFKWLQCGKEYPENAPPPQSSSSSVSSPAVVKTALDAIHEAKPGDDIEDIQENTRQANAAIVEEVITVTNAAGSLGFFKAIEAVAKTVPGHNKTDYKTWLTMLITLRKEGTDVKFTRSRYLDIITKRAKEERSKDGFRFSRSVDEKKKEHLMKRMREMAAAYDPSADRFHHHHIDSKHKETPAPASSASASGSSSVSLGRMRVEDDPVPPAAAISDGVSMAMLD